MPQNDGTTDPVTPDSTPNTPEVTKNSLPDSENWQNRYAGLQRVYQKLQTESETKITGLTTQVNDLTAQLEALRQSESKTKTSESALQAKLKENETQTGSLNSEITSLKARLERAMLIMSEYQDLAQFEAKELIPMASTPEDQKKVFESFREALKTTVGSQVVTQLQGTTPAGSNTKQTNTAGGETEDYIWQQMAITAGRDTVKFKEWQAKWDEIQSRKTKK